MPIAFVQSKSTWPTTSASSTALAYTSNVQTGGLLVCVVMWNSTSVTCTVADNVNGAWTALGGPQDGTGGLASFRTQMFCRPNAAAGSTTVTATFSAAVTRRGIAILEYSGCDTSASPNDAAAVYLNVFETSSPFNSGDITTTTNDTVLVSACLSADSIGSMGGSFTQRENANFGTNAVGDRIVAAAGTYHGVFSDISNNFDETTVICAFKIATAAVLIPTGAFQ